MKNVYCREWFWYVNFGIYALANLRGVPYHILEPTVYIIFIRI